MRATASPRASLQLEHETVGAIGRHRDHDAATGRSTLTTGKAVVLGLVEGATEYLPVSSTGHLLITERILDVGQSPAEKSVTDTYTVVIQIGAILAVLGIFRNRFTLMLEGVVGRSVEGRNTLLAVIVAFVPAGIIGKLFGDQVKEHLLSPTPVAITWIVGGLVILAFVAQQSKLRPRITSVADIGVRNAAIIGLAHLVRTSKLDPEQRERLGKIDSAAHHLLEAARALHDRAHQLLAVSIATLSIPNDRCTLRRRAVDGHRSRRSRNRQNPSSYSAI